MNGIKISFPPFSHNGIQRAGEAVLGYCHLANQSRVFLARGNKR